MGLDIERLSRQSAVFGSLCRRNYTILRSRLLVSEDFSRRQESEVPKLGEYLLDKGLISRQDLEYALQLQTQSAEPLGQILLAFSLIRREELYQALSHLWSLPYRRLDEEPCIAQPIWPVDRAVAWQAVVLSEENGHLRVATARRPDAELARALADYYPDHSPTYFITTHWDIDNYLRRCYRQIILDRSIFNLYQRNRDYSAYTVLTRLQFFALVLVLLSGFMAIVSFPRETLIALNIAITIFFLITVMFKFFVGIAGAYAENEIDISKSEVDALRDEELPRYTVLVPVYREAGIVSRVMEHVAALDYPKAKLEILILIEEDDAETWNAARQSNPPDFVHMIRIPHGLPKTKPKACNVGLSFARGEYLVIYDAEDIPDPDQLKKVFVAFQKGPENLICIQAALNYFNAEENWLTRMFTLEYSYWFDYILPGLAKLGLPIPLGGTSNHFRVDRLRELAGWDPFNVTEDADLGVRASALGYQVGIVNSTTLEEANNHLPNWIRQRSRWIKGYMQTALVHSRHPLRLLRSIGLKQTLGFALLIGGTPIAFLVYVPTILIYMLWLFSGTHAFDPYFPPWVLDIGLFNLTMGNAFAIYLSMLAVFKRRQFSLMPYSLTNPIYWVLHSISAYKGLWQLMTKPFFWEKTNHGLTKSK